MKKMVIATLLIAVFLMSGMSMFANYSIPLIVETDGGDKVDNLVFGWNEIATVGVDKHLGEITIPIMDLPGGLFYAYFIIADPDPGVGTNGSYRDYRPFNEETGKIEFEIRTASRDLNENITFSWPQLQNAGLDSAFFEDIDPEINIFSFDMLASQQAVIENPDIKRFMIRLHFKITNVAENQGDTAPALQVFPNPTTDYLQIKTEKEVRKIEIFNNVGNKIEVKSVNDYIDVTELPTGIYFLQVFYHNGQSGRMMFQKIN
jgi:Secretion system C-terminal sorting domain